MPQGEVVEICICPAKGALMQSRQEVEALEGLGLQGDRYATGEGSFNRGRVGHRQVSLMNAIFFTQAMFGFSFEESRRNILVSGLELMTLIGHEFEIGEARMRGVKYCDPCERPSKLAGRKSSFKEEFFDRGGLIAEVVSGGLIMIGDSVIPL